MYCFCLFRSKKQNTLTVGQIIGIVNGVTFVVICLLLSIYCQFYRKKARRKGEREPVQDQQALVNEKEGEAVHVEEIASEPMTQEISYIALQSQFQKQQNDNDNDTPMTGQEGEGGLGSFGDDEENE